MRFLPVVLAAALCCAFVARNALLVFDPLDAVSPDDVPLVAPPDLQVTLWAESPSLYNPTNIDVDARGRVWVAEGVNYRDFNNTRQDSIYRAAGDRIVILEDTDRDGIADHTKVFVQDPDLRAPLGLAVIGNRVYVSNSPSIIVYTDRDGDDVPDDKEVFLTGFGGYDHDHGLHALTAGPDGSLYLNTGNAGPHHVTDRSGWTLRSGSMYTGGTPYNTENHGAQTSDDGRVWVGGLALRVRPDGTGLEVLAHNFRNSYEIALDSYGNIWQNDNDDEVVATRTTWVMEGGNAGYFSADGTRNWQADRRPGQSTFTAHWHQDDPGVLPAGDRVGAGSPTGVVFYEGDQLGSDYRGMLLSADAGRNTIFGYRPEPDGAGFRLNRFNWITSVEESTEGYVWNQIDGDPRKRFRPSDVAVGPDGAVYIADWYDAVVGGHQARDGAAYGRIYRIAPKDRALTVPALDLTSTEGQIQALRSPAVHVRALGFQRLVARGDTVLTDVQALLEAPNPFHRARALWVLSQLGPAGRDVVRDHLTHTDPALRLTAFRALRGGDANGVDLAEPLIQDPDPAVRREVALALRDVPYNRKQPLLMDLAERFDGTDPWYLEALGQAAVGDEAAAYTDLKERFGGPAASWDTRFAALAWRLHPTSAVEDLKQRALAEGVTTEEKQRALTALAFVRDRSAAEAMQAVAREADDELAQTAAWWLQFRKTNEWSDFLQAYVPPTAASPIPDTTGVHQLHALLATVEDTTLLVDQRVDAATELAHDPLGGRLLLLRLAGEPLLYQIRAAVNGAIGSNPDQTVRSLARPFLGASTDTSSSLIQAAQAHTPDGERGSAVFAAQCATCHRFGALGQDVGPDLTDIRSKFDATGLLDAVVHPDAAVAFTYRPWLIETRDGYVHTGFVVGDGATLTVKDPYGRLQQIPAAEVVRREQFEASLMPAPSDLRLGAQDLSDLTAYLLGGIE